MSKAIDTLRYSLKHEDAKNLTKVDVHVVNNEAFYLINKRVSWKAIKLIKKQVALINSKLPLPLMLTLMLTS
jgi:hypothetical protein